MELHFKNWLIDEAMIGNPGTPFVGPTPTNACDACKATASPPKPSTACPACLVSKSWRGNPGNSGTPGSQTGTAAASPTITPTAASPAATAPPTKTDSQPTKTAAK